MVLTNQEALGWPLKRAGKLHFPISSGFGWRLCDANPKEWKLCSSLHHFMGLWLSSVCGDDQLLRMSSSINAEAAERPNCSWKVRDFIPRPFVFVTSHVPRRFVPLPVIVQLKDYFKQDSKEIKHIKISHLVVKMVTNAYLLFVQLKIILNSTH